MMRHSAMTRFFAKTMVERTGSDQSGAMTTMGSGGLAGGAISIDGGTLIGTAATRGTGTGSAST